MPSKKNNKKKYNYDEVGYIASYFSGVAKVRGLPHVLLNEVLLDEDGRPVALVVGFDENFAEALFFEEDFDQQKPVFRSFRTFKIKVSENSLGRVFDGLGRPLDNLGDIRKGEERDVFAPAPQVFEREEVATPLFTGIKIIDTNLPLGRGQRELIVGDRKLGKSAIAVDVVLNQRYADPPVYCIYVLSSQKEKKLRELIELFEENNAFLYTTIVAATADTSFCQQYLAPFVGCAIGEYFRDRGKDVLVVYDDLSKHAKLYRSISLLLERSPGRETYPGDIFSLHAQLLERAAKLSKEKGGGSLSALPIIETQEGDVTSFIPTNLISITDGQIYLERGLFQKGFIPAVNVGLSVSRVGGRAQPKTLREVVGGLRLALSQHKELQKLSQLETAVSAESQKKIQRGELILELLKQEEHTYFSPPEQTILFYAVEKGFFDDLKKEKWRDFEKKLLEAVKSRSPLILKEIGKGLFGEETKKELEKVIIAFKEEFSITSI
jgi:F-type H+-transporting ATPase subunit alpha